MRPLIRPMAIAFAIAVSVRASHAQATVAADVGFNSQYIWRGVTSTNRLVIQPDLSISVPVRGLTLLAGAWGNIEPVRYDGATDISSLYGLPGPFITQSEAWVEVGGAVAKRVDTAFGVHGYFYPHVADLWDYNTVELYTTLSMDAAVSPTVSINYDVARIRGAYVEAGLSRAITGERHGSVTLSALAGFSAGQAQDSTSRDLAYFDRNGLTHVDASAYATFAIGHVSIAPEAHVIIAHDAFATVAAPDVTRRTKLWIGTTLSWTSARESR